jgi:hypothetical protein
MGTLKSKIKQLEEDNGWPHRPAQYQKAMRISLDPALWPAQEIELPWPQETQELILRDGTRVKSGGSAVERFQITAGQSKDDEIGRDPGGTLFFIWHCIARPL